MRSLRKDASGITLYPYDQAWHAAGTEGGRGRCGQHGIGSCKEPPVVSFHDHKGRRQAGLERVRRELLARGAIDGDASLCGIPADRLHTFGDMTFDTSTGAGRCPECNAIVEA